MRQACPIHSTAGSTGATCMFMGQMSLASTAKSERARLEGLWTTLEMESSGAAFGEEKKGAGSRAGDSGPGLSGYEVWSGA